MRCDEVHARFDDLWDGVADVEVRQHLSMRAGYVHSMRETTWRSSAGRVSPVEAAKMRPESFGGVSRRAPDAQDWGATSNSPSVTEFFERVGKALCLRGPGSHFPRATGSGKSSFYGAHPGPDRRRYARAGSCA